MPPGFIAFGQNGFLVELLLPYNEEAWPEDRASQGCASSASSRPEWTAAFGPPSG